MLLHPIIPPDLVNCVIVPAKPTSSLFGTVTVVYKDKSSRDKRHPVIQAVLKNAVATIVQGDTDPDTLLQVMNPSHDKLLILLQCLLLTYCLFSGNNVCLFYYYLFIIN